ncbi:MAG TPA: hypothetical protein G4O02_16370 [Caldilineae bacterium]|nr:hypothetical protein [Caldilineae bacterium]
MAIIWDILALIAIDILLALMIASRLDGFETGSARSPLQSRRARRRITSSVRVKTPPGREPNP